MTSDTQSGTQNSYFVALGEDRYMPTAHASGAWREDELHLAPVAGLVIHHMERWRQENIDPSLTFSRFSMDILGQIGREEIQLSTEVLRPGRTIELIETTAVIAGRATIRARAWLLQNGDTSSVVGEEFDALPRFEECEDVTGELGWPGGFIASVKAAQAPGRRPGRNKIWITSELPLVEGEEAQPLAEFCKLLDTANGVAVRQKPEEWMYPNVDLTFHIFREPQGIQMGLDTRVAFGANGIGLTSSVVHDAEGPVGTLNQSLTLRKL